MRSGDWSASSSMGTTVHVCTVGAGRRAASEAHRIVAEVDAALSRFRTDSDVSRVNATGAGPVGHHYLAVASAAERYRAATGGAFDPEAGGDGVDFGAIAKGYAADLACEICLAEAEGALVSLGTSSISVAGTSPARDPWRIAISSPWGEREPTLGFVEVDRGAFSMSGVRGRRRAPSLTVEHLRDPRTDGAVHTDVAAVGVLSDDGMLSEAMSTAAMVVGLERGFALCVDQGVGGLFLTSAGEVIATPDLAPRVRLREPKRR